MGQYDLALAKYDDRWARQRVPAKYLLISDVRFARKEWAEIIAMNEKSWPKSRPTSRGVSAIGYAYSQLGQWDKASAPS
jgi:hypothetical protein